MCGITGIWNFNGRDVDPAVLERMTTLLHHRGPDDHGYALFDRQGDCVGHGREMGAWREGAALGLGHRRLSIIDLSETGRQPMASGNGRYWICYNGEVYNYLELREELKGLGHAFAGASDTEVILKAYEQWGTQCVERFNGMWAFALWDARERNLFCSRDRVGIKPFYYYLDEETFIFASEIKAVLAALPREKHNLNKPYLGRFILSGLLDDADETLFGQIKQLPVAHGMQIRGGGQRNQWRFWDISDECVARADEGLIKEEEATERFRELLSDAIRLRFRSDVPVGTCLSGGLDSSSVVALATRDLSAKLKTFTTEYNEKEFSEGHYARAAAKRFETEAYYITPQAKQYTDFIDRFSWYHDEPCPGPGPFSQWHVMELASRHVKVVLDGQGADELLGGYPHYFNYYLTSVLRRVFSRGPGRATLRQYFADSDAIARHTQTSFRKSCLTALSHIANRMLPEWLRAMSKPVRGLSAGPMFDLADRELLRSALPPYGPRPRRYRDDLNDILYWELVRDNIPMLMQYGDRTSMAFSIESRVPFLDYRLIEYMGSLPFRMKIRANTTKFIMRRAMRGILPDKVVDRPDKKGYPTPFSIWLKGPINQYARDLIGGSSFRQRGIFHPAKVEKLLDDHCAGKADHAWLLWRVMNVEKWLQVFHDDFAGACRRHLAGRF